MGFANGSDRRIWDGPALSQPSPARSSALSQEEAPAAVFSNRGSGSGSGDLDVVGIDAGDIKDSPPHTPAYERFMEVVTCTVAKLNIDWPAKKQEVQKKSLLDKRFLPSPHRRLPFFCNLHTELSKSWRNGSHILFSALKRQTIVISQGWNNMFIVKP